MPPQLTGDKSNPHEFVFSRAAETVKAGLGREEKKGFVRSMQQQFGHILSKLSKDEILAEYIAAEWFVRSLMDEK